MPTHVALLRGINVGGRKPVAMADLRRVFTELGHTQVATYIQSGNVVFTASTTDTSELAVSLERSVAARLGIAAPVVLLTRDALAAVVAGNPFPAETDGRRLHAIFHAAPLDADVVAGVARAVELARGRGGADDAVVVGRTIYLHTPDGYGRSDLAARLARRTSGRGAQATGTARNWATVVKLLSLMDG